jgi:DnaJ-class molecular chaperone
MRFMESSKTVNYICEKCNGTGQIFDRFTLKERMCYRCNGEGKLNWIDNIFGKKQERHWREVLDEIIDNNLMKEYLKRIKGCW